MIDHNKNAEPNDENFFDAVPTPVILTNGSIQSTEYKVIKQNEIYSNVVLQAWSHMFA